MIRPRPSVAEQLAEVEYLVEELRWARSPGSRAAPCTVEHHDAHLLRAVLACVAADLRGRMADSRSTTARVLQQRIDDAHRSKTDLGYSHGALLGIGQEVIGRWPVLRRALELAETMSETEETRG